LLSQIILVKEGLFEKLICPSQIKHNVTWFYLQWCWNPIQPYLCKTYLSYIKILITTKHIVISYSSFSYLIILLWRLMTKSVKPSHLKFYLNNPLTIYILYIFVHVYSVDSHPIMVCTDYRRTWRLKINSKPSDWDWKKNNQMNALRECRQKWKLEY